MSDLELIALAASDPDTACKRIEQLLHLHLRENSNSDEHAISVAAGSTKTSFEISLRSTTFTLVCEVDLRAVSEIVFDFKKVFRYLAEEFNRRSDAQLQGLLSFEQAIPSKELSEVDLPKSTVKTVIEDAIAAHIV